MGAVVSDVDVPITASESTPALRVAAPMIAIAQGAVRLQWAAARVVEIRCADHRVGPPRPAGTDVALDLEIDEAVEPRAVLVEAIGPGYANAVVGLPTQGGDRGAESLCFAGPVGTVASAVDRTEAEPAGRAMVEEAMSRAAIVGVVAVVVDPAAIADPKVRRQRLTAHDRWSE